MAALCVEMRWTYQQFLAQPEWFIEDVVAYLNELHKPKKK